jgi:Holliday junction resolvase
MVNGRNKGASFEREVANMLRDELGIGFKRDLEQYRAGAHADLIPDDPAFPFTLELKRYKDGPIGGAPAWWEQVKTAAEREQKMPCLIYKYDRKPMRCVIPLAALTNCDHDYTVEVDFETLCYIAREAMQ